MLARFRKRSSRKIKEIRSFEVSSSIKSKSLTSRTIAKLVAEFASDKKAFNIVILDMRKLVNFCDYFVICSGNSDRQALGIAQGIQEGFEKRGMYVPRLEGAKDTRWVVLDVGGVIAHIFEKATREFYGLDYLWQDAKKLTDHKANDAEHD